MGKNNRTLALTLGLCLAAAIVLLFVTGRQNVIAPSQDLQLQITEICTKNDSIIPDDQGKYRDYVEIYNAGEMVNLRGFCLTDGSRTSQPFGDVYLTKGSYRVFFLSKETTGFGLSASGKDTVQLLDPSGQVVCQANTAPMGADEVMVRLGGSYMLSHQASPGFANDAAGVAAFRAGSPVQSAPLHFTELLVDNTSALPNGLGEFPDAVELYNGGDETVNLADFWLSDSLDNRFLAPLPDKLLAPGEYAVVFCDGQSLLDEQGFVHVGFGLRSGDTLCLTDRRGGTLTLEVSRAGKRNTSLALSGGGSFEAAPVSLGYPNTEEGAALFAASRIDPSSPLVISEVLLSGAGVPYNQKIADVVELVNRSDRAVDTAGWYLSDGGDPYDSPLPRAVLQPGEHLVVECGWETTGFSLAQGETVLLLGPDGKTAEPVACLLQPGRSIALQPGSDAYADSEVSIGHPNTAQGREAFGREQLPGDLQISEVMTANRSWLAGPYGKASDWVELYNPTRQTIRLGGYSLGVSPDPSQSVALPDAELAPGAYLVLLLSEDGLDLPQGYSALPFNLSASGEGLYLSKDGRIVDGLYIPALLTDTSYGRAQGSSAFSLLQAITPGQPNAGPAVPSPMPTALTPQGVYEAVSYVDVALEAQGDIYYTTDCSYPGQDATRYTGPIRLTETTVIRAVCRQPGAQASQTLDLTYVINEGSELSVVTLVAEPEDLWSPEAGIYTPGYGAGGEMPYYGANYWQTWEKPATVSLFEQDGGGFSQACGIRIFGGYSRMYEKKSLALFFRDSYGAAQLRYPLFGEEGLDTYQAFVLRAGGQDVYNARMRDELVASLALASLEVPVQKYRPVALYINGEYWGLHYIREKINEHFVAGNYSVPASSVTMGERHGDTVAEYQAVMEYARTHDLRDAECYAYICQQVNVQELMDYTIVQLCAGNKDNSNVKFFRIGSGQWSWVLFDQDLSFQEPGYNAFLDVLNPEGTSSHRISTALINGLLTNPEFRDAFLRRMAWQLENIWNSQTLLAAIEALAGEIDGEMPRDCARWGQSYDQWQQAVEGLRIFAREREGFLLGQIQGYFGLSAAQMRGYGFRV